MEITLAIASVVFGIVSLAYAIFTNRQKARLENLVQVSLATLAESINQARNSTRLAYSHIDDIRRFVQALNQTDESKSVLDHVTWMHGDITAAHRILKIIKDDVLSLQKGMFQSQPIQSKLDKSETEALK